MNIKGPRMCVAAGMALTAMSAFATGWEFTGDISREAVASETVEIAGDFDSRQPPDIWLTGFRFSSFPPTGFLLFFR